MTFQNTQLLETVKMQPQHVWYLSILAAGSLLAGWVVFWYMARRESVSSVIKEPAFFKTITVMGVVAAVVVLSLADKIAGELTASILSGIVGYVLGSVASTPKPLVAPPSEKEAGSSPKGVGD